MVFLIFSVHSGKDSLNVSFSSMIRFQSHSSNEGCDGRQRQVKVGMVVSLVYVCVYCDCYLYSFFYSCIHVYCCGQ